MSKAPVIKVVIGSVLILCACTSREQRIGADDGTDPCRPQLVAFDSTGNFFGEDVARGAAVGAAAGALLGVAVAAIAGQKRSDLGVGAAAGAAAGGAFGAAGGYLQARQRQARDQAGLVAGIAGDLERENAGLDRAQLAFDRLMDCRFALAKQTREAFRAGHVQRAEAEARMQAVRAWLRRDAALARRFDSRVAARGAEFDTAVESVSPGAKAFAEAQRPSAAASVPAQAQEAVPLRLRPAPDAPEVGRLQTRQPVLLRAAAPGYALVEVRDGERGYAPVGSFALEDAARSAGLATPPRDAPPLATPGDVRSLAASNLVRRDNFSESVSNAERAAASGGGFELAS